MVKVDEEDQKFWIMLVNVPQTHKAIAVLCLLTNILLPGFGTMFAACGGYTDTVSKTQLAIGVVQFLTSFALVGWVLSIYWGYLIVRKAWEEDENN